MPDKRITEEALAKAVESFNTKGNQRFFIEVTHSQWHMLMAALQTTAARVDGSEGERTYILEFVMWTLVDASGFEQLADKMIESHKQMLHLHKDS